jgi:spermidine synthase
MPKVREIRVKGASMSRLPSGRLLTGYAWDALTAAALLRPAGPPRTLLLLGLGGGTMLHQLLHLHPGTRVTAVDLDPAMIRTARWVLRKHSAQLELIHADALRWVAATRSRRFDVVIDDLYAAGEEDVFKPVCPDRAWVESLHRLRGPGGAVLMNLVTGPGHHRVRLQARSVFRRMFGHVVSVRPPLGVNEVLWGGDTPPDRSALRAADGRWTQARDRSDWRRLRVGKVARL